MKIVTTFHQPSSILSSVKCQLSSRDLEHLVVAKVNRIDVYSLQPHGLQHQCGLEIWGKVLTIRSIPVTGTLRSGLVLMITHPDPELVFLTYTESGTGSAELTATKQLSLYERTPRPAEFFNDILVHPSGKLAVVSCYTGKLKIITLKGGSYAEDFDVSLPELNLFGLAFLPVPDDEFALAILHQDCQDRIQLLARDILVDDLELSSHASTVLTPTSVSSKILPFATETTPILMSVPVGSEEDVEEGEGSLGGVLIIGGRKILLFELSSREGQAKQRGKRRRLESRKGSNDAAEVAKAKEKERERETRKRKAKGSVDWPWSEVTAVCAVDQDTPRYFIGDSYGRLSMLSLDRLQEFGLVLLPLGEGSPPTTLTYLTTQTLFLGSHLGDSQLVQISPTPISSLTSPTLAIPPEIKTINAARLSAPNSGKGNGRAVGEEEVDPRGSVVGLTGSFVNVVDTFKNIAPIMDAALVDIDGSGERQIVTCSGGGNKGSINIVRNGADFQELASIPGLTDVTNIWGVRDRFEDKTDAHVFMSTLQASYLFRINDAGGNTTLTHVKNSGLITDSPTLAFSNVASRVITNGKASYKDSQLVVQVTRKGAFLLEYDMALASYTQLAGWQLSGMEVVAASINPSQVVLGLNGGGLVALSIAEDKTIRVVVQGNQGALPEISTVSCVPLDPSKPFTRYITVSYWGTNIVEIFEMASEGFRSVSKTHPLPALARSVLLYNFGSDHNTKGEDYNPHLLVGLSDGSVAYFPWKDMQLKDKKVISLGHSPVSLTACHVDGKRAVFAAGNRTTVLSWEKKRIHSSPIMLKKIVAASRLNTKTFESCLVLATASGLFVGRVRDLDKMHIRSIPLGLDNPRRLAYQPILKVFGVACTRVEPARIGDPEVTHSFFRLFDDSTFSSLTNFICDSEEEITAVATFSPVIDGKPMPLFCLGTFTYVPDEKEPTKGRILIFTAHTSEGQAKSSGLQLFLVTSVDVKGCVYSITITGDMIVASVNSAVMLYRLKQDEDVESPTITLQLLSEWNHNYLVTSLASYGDHIVAGDQISSVSLLKVVDSKLQNVARDYGPLWPICVEALDEENIIGANDALNLFTFTLTRTLGRAVLECDGNYHLADFVTKFIRGSLTSSDSSSSTALTAKHVFFTSSGRIGVVVDVTDESLSLHLSALQRNLAGALPGVGGVSHTRFRAPKNTRGRSDADLASFGFIDGDFLEQFLTHLGSQEQVDKIIAGHSDPEKLTLPVNEIQQVLENLQSMH